MICQRVKYWIGLPVCVGIGAIKTLAKLANHIAKKNPVWNGVCDLGGLSEQVLNDLLAGIKVGEVWRIERRIRENLAHRKINTVLELKQADTTFIGFFLIGDATYCYEVAWHCPSTVEEIILLRRQIICRRSSVCL